MTPKHVLASKTVWSNLAVLAVTVLESAEFINVIPQEWVPFIPVALAVLNVGLRGVTTRPVRIGGAK